MNIPNTIANFNGARPVITTASVPQGPNGPLTPPDSPECAARAVRGT